MSIFRTRAHGRLYGEIYDKIYCCFRANFVFSCSFRALHPREHELEKKRAYQQRVQDIEHSSFTPLVLSVTGGMGVEATTFYKRLAELLSQKWDSPYSKTLHVCWLRCRLSFSLIRSALQAIRGARSSQGRAAHLPTSVDLITTEARISPQ